MAILEVKNLKKNFGELEVLKGIDFSLEKGDVMAVIGSSGNGKTTLLRCINFLETPNEGEIIVNGETLFDASEKDNSSESDIRKKRLHFGLVFQNNPTSRIDDLRIRYRPRIHPAVYKRRICSCHFFYRNTIGKSAQGQSGIKFIRIDFPVLTLFIAYHRGKGQIFSQKIE